MGGGRLMLWTWDRDSACYLSGSHNDGCGVFTDKKGWYYNVVVAGNDMITSDGPFETLDGAKEAAESEYKSRKL
jgi:hypothetical protein